jgi:hypothetical protein
MNSNTGFCVVALGINCEFDDYIVFILIRDGNGAEK